MRAFIVTLTAVAVLIVVGWACGSSADPTAGSCDRPSVDSEATCYDISGHADFLRLEKTACGTIGGTWRDRPCSQTGVVGGCRNDTGDGNLITIWFYASATVTSAADVTSHCESGQTFVMPPP